MEKEIIKMKEVKKNTEKITDMLKDETKEMIDCFIANENRSFESKELFSTILAELGRDYEGTKRVLNLMKRIDNDYLERD